mmetsp:Transcript_29820/g.74601  ORF Transcript_29820/g.74601 Transcript_29820/m.74601 type:complete len:264 (-) Transcript_29820:996-1787(-)
MHPVPLQCHQLERLCRGHAAAAVSAGGVVLVTECHVQLFLLDSGEGLLETRHQARESRAMLRRIAFLWTFPLMWHALCGALLLHARCLVCSSRNCRVGRVGRVLSRCVCAFVDCCLCMQPCVEALRSPCVDIQGDGGPRRHLYVIGSRCMLPFDWLPLSSPFSYRLAMDRLLVGSCSSPTTESLSENSNTRSLSLLTISTTARSTIPRYTSTCTTHRSCPQLASDWLLIISRSRLGEWRRFGFLFLMALCWLPWCNWFPSSRD